MYIDTHSHLFVKEFDDDREEVIKRATDNQIRKIFLPNISPETVESMEKMVDDYPGICYPMIGIHPTEIKKDWKKQMEQIQTFYRKGRHIAIGEIGIDLYWDKSLKQEQSLAFREQVRWAKREKLPVVIHSRESFDEIFEIIDKENDDSLFGVFHCFTGTAEQAQHIIDYGGFKFGIGGVVTFKNSGLDKVLEKIDLKHIILETDSPYLAPAPFRGKRNESSYIPIIVNKLSEIYNVSEEKIGEATTKNTLEVFKI